MKLKAPQVNNEMARKCTQVAVLQNQFHMSLHTVLSSLNFYAQRAISWKQLNVAMIAILE